MRIFRTILVLTVFIVVSSCSSEAKRDNYYENAKKYLAEEKYSEAEIEFLNALKADSNHIPSMLGLADTFRKRGNDESAIGLYQKVAAMDPSNVESRLAIGRYFLAAAGTKPELFQTALAIAQEINTKQPTNIEGQVLLGNTYTAVGEIGKSIKELQSAVFQDPNHLEALVGLGTAHLRFGNTDKAERVFREVVEKHPEAVEAHLILASFLAWSGRADEAEAAFKIAFDLAPTDPKTLATFSSFYVSSKRGGEAEKLLTEAISRHPEARDPRLALANFYFRQGAQSKAQDVLTDLLKIKPDDRPAQLRLAEIYLNANEQNKADAIIKSVLAVDKANAEAQALNGRLLRERDKPSEAFAEFDSAIKSNSTLIPPHIEKANLQMVNGDLPGAEKTLRAALEVDKSNLLVRGFLAKVLALQRKSQDALQEATAVLASMPQNEDAMAARGDALFALGRFDESVKQFLKLCEMRPKYPFYWHRLGLVEASHGDVKNASVHLRKALELKPDMAAATNDLVVLYIKAKQYDVAFAELERLSKTTREDEVHRLRGHVYLAKQEVGSAEREFLIATQLNPNNPLNYLSLAELSVARSDGSQAMKYLDQLLARDTKIPQAYLMKANLLQVANDRAGAISHYRKALELDPENAEVANNLAWALLEEGKNLDESLSLAKTAKKLRPNDPEMADTLGWIQYKMKNYPQAIDHLKFSVGNRPRPEAEHYYRLGMAYYGNGDLRLAEQTLRKALQSGAKFPGSEEAQRIVQSLN